VTEPTERATIVTNEVAVGLASIGAAGNGRYT
jgi:hypothetical protein